MGGWDADQSASETLRLVKQHVEELEIDIDMADSFVPGLRRGFAIVPIAPRAGKTRVPSEAESEIAFDTSVKPK